MRGLCRTGAGARPLARRLVLGGREPAPTAWDRSDGGRRDEILEIGGGGEDVGRRAVAAGGHCDRRELRCGVSVGMRGRDEARRVGSGQRHAMEHGFLVRRWPELRSHGLEARISVCRWRGKRPCADDNINKNPDRAGRGVGSG